ncbi:hypothetical protein [Paraburkholderia sp. HD33-4]|uniref:hypothetical protein n=1 Tax=Paraburkholderia sp. HD33-4 TaxID=2883242 RepID=UPI001F1B2681|nr:hypothetical protein [Paraburkholderia sp. HD33-4]
MDLQTEVEHLWLADEHVALARRCAEQQRQIVSRLCMHSLDVTEARRLLETMQDTVAVACEHRALILRIVAQLLSKDIGGDERLIALADSKDISRQGSAVVVI